MDPTDRMLTAQTGGGIRIGTARDHVGPVRAGQVTLAGWFHGQALARGFQVDDSPRGTVLAQVNHGRWIVDCAVCAGAEDADYHEPLFYCLSCGNAENEGHVMQVIFPKEREQIEAVLLQRPIANRNWRPSENVMDLIKENFEHGGKP